MGACCTFDGGDRHAGTRAGAGFRTVRGARAGLRSRALPLGTLPSAPKWRHIAVALALLGLVLAIGLLQPGGLFAPVDQLAMRIVAHAREWPVAAALTQGSLWLDMLGEGGARLWIACVIAFFLAGAGRAADIVWLLATVAAMIVINPAMKLLFLAPRPDMIEHLAIVTSHSFPSGHAAGAMTLYGAIGMVLRHRGAWALCGAMILATGASRVWLGVHWPSDVIGGWIEGLAWLIAMSLALPERPESR